MKTFDSLQTTKNIGKLTINYLIYTAQTKGEYLADIVISGANKQESKLFLQYVEEKDLFTGGENYPTICFIDEKRINDDFTHKICIRFSHETNASVVFSQLYDSLKKVELVTEKSELIDLATFHKNYESAPSPATTLGS